MSVSGESVQIQMQKSKLNPNVLFELSVCCGQHTGTIQLPDICLLDILLPDILLLDILGKAIEFVVCELINPASTKPA
jgi:hypothetical protein